MTTAVHGEAGAGRLDADLEYAIDTTGREQRLRSRVAALRTRRPGGSRERWLLTVGGVLMPLGAVLVLLGWAGASRTPLVFEQIPYMISGGLLGLAVVFAGGFIYFSYWQTAMVREQRAARTELTASLGRIEELLAALPLVVEPPSLPQQGNGLAQQLVATPTGSMMHRPDCTVVASRDGLRAVSPGEGRLTPCRLCEPLLD